MMSAARAGDALRIALGAARNPCVTGVNFENVLGLGTGSIRLEPFLTVICGGNGAGKSSLLSVVHAALTPDDPLLEPFRLARLRGSRLEVHLQVGSGSFAIARSFDDDGVRIDVGGGELPEGFSVVSIDLAREAREIVQWARSSGRDEQLEGAPMRELTGHELKALSNAVRKSYGIGRVYEVELSAEPADFSSAVRVFPYFEVSEDRPEAPIYGAGDMGQGEVVMHLLSWHLRRLPRGSLALIEEPDAHLPDVSQDAVLNALSLSGEKRATSFVISTHSARIVTSVPAPAVRVVFRQGDGIRIREDPRLEAARHSLDIDVQQRVLIVCEDATAAHIVETLLRASGSPLVSIAEVRTGESKSHMEAFLSNMPLTGPWFSAVGVFDGNERADPPAPMRWPYVFLPETAAPEVWLRRLANANPGQVASLLQIDEEMLEILLSATRGLEPHEWLRTCQQRLNVSRQDLVSAICKVWARDPENEGALRSFAGSLERVAQALHVVAAAPRALAATSPEEQRTAVLGELVALAEIVGSGRAQLGEPAITQLRGLVAAHDRECFDRCFRDSNPVLRAD
jgi:hypothetical protein